MAIRLTRDGNGGYRTPDGRFTLVPVNMGEGVSNGRRWSKGRKEWRLTDTSGAATLGAYGNRPSMIVDTLYRARDIIEAHTEKG